MMAGLEVGEAAAKAGLAPIGPQLVGKKECCSENGEKNRNLI
jgi:hypothetical protein